MVTFIVDRNINYTNVCTTGCDFCAFYRPPGLGGGLPALARRRSSPRSQETLELGGTAIMLQGGLHPDLGIEYYEDLFRWIKARFPITIHSLSPPEILHIAGSSGLTVRGDAARGCARPGSTRSRAAAPRSWWTACAERWPRARPRTDEWLEVMREAHAWACAPRPP